MRHSRDARPAAVVPVQRPACSLCQCCSCCAFLGHWGMPRVAPALHLHLHSCLLARPRCACGAPLYTRLPVRAPCMPHGSGRLPHPWLCLPVPFPLAMPSQNVPCALTTPAQAPTHAEGCLPSTHPALHGAPTCLCACDAFQQLVTCGFLPVCMCCLWRSYWVPMCAIVPQPAAAARRSCMAACSTPAAGAARPPARMLAHQ